MILSALLSLILILVGLMIFYTGRNQTNDYYAVSLMVISCTLMAIGIMWMGDLFGFQVGLDGYTLRLILIIGAAVFVGGLVFLKAEKLIKKR